VPEEVNRKIVDHVSDINLTYTEHARRYLLREGLRPETVIKTGSPMREVIEYFRPGIDGSDVLSGWISLPLNITSSAPHREENVDDELNFGDLIRTLKALAETEGKSVVVSTHPRTGSVSRNGASRWRIRIRF